MRCCRRPSLCGSLLSPPLPKDCREEKAEPVAPQVAGGSSLASGTRVLSQNSSAARCFCSVSIPNGDGCRCPRGGRLNHRASTHDLFRYRKFHTSKKRSCLSRVVPPPRTAATRYAAGTWPPHQSAEMLRRAAASGDLPGEFNLAGFTRLPEQNRPPLGKGRTLFSVFAWSNG